MAEETVKPTMENNEPKATIVDVKDVPEAEVNPPTKEEETSPVKEAPAEKQKEEVVSETKAMLVGDEKVDTIKTTEEKDDESCQFSEYQTKALVEFKKLLQDAISNREFQSQAAPVVEETKPEAPEEAEEVEEAEKVEESVVETVELEEKKEVVVDEEEAGTKTVEAIEETIVSSLSPEKQQQHEKKDEEEVEKEIMPPLEEVSIWGVPLLKDERTDTILWKFLQARDFKVSEAMHMLKNTLKWRKEFGIDELIEGCDVEGGDDGDLAKAVFMHGVSKEGSPVCYNVYGVFQDKEVYERAFGDEEKREKFLKLRILSLEKSVRKLDFRPGGVSTIVQVNDLRNFPGLGKWELRQATKHALHLLQDNYPEFVAKQVFINVPWWYVAVNKMISPFLTQRTKSKFVLAGPSKSAETLFNYVAPEQVPVQYGGLSRKGDFETTDGATQIIVKAASKETVEFAVTEACHLTWEVRVLGWEVSYGAEFVPSTKDGYTVIIQKIRKVGPNEETIITSNFKTSEPGKVVLTIDNSSSKKKRLLYRLKSMPSSD